MKIRPTKEAPWVRIHGTMFDGLRTTQAKEAICTVLRHNPAWRVLIDTNLLFAAQPRRQERLVFYIHKDLLKEDLLR